MEVSAIVVTYNSAGCVTQCVRSLQAQQGVSLEIVVVDNASADETTAAVRRSGGGVRVIANQDNIGFGRGCNQGFAGCNGRFVFLLNPDARLEGTDALAQLVRAMDRNKRWGIAGMRLLGEDGEVESMGETHYPSEKRAGCDFSHLPGPLAWVSGACMFIRRETFQEVEGFDPGFFLTSEETDLCLRVRQHGWEVGVVPEVTVRHIGMASENGADPYDTWFRRVPGIMRFWSKHYPATETRRLVQRDWFRASFRREWYGLVSRFSGAGSEAWRKHRKYAGISEASRQFLENGK